MDLKNLTLPPKVTLYDLYQVCVPNFNFLAWFGGEKGGKNYLFFKVKKWKKILVLLLLIILRGSFLDIVFLDYLSIGLKIIYFSIFRLSVPPPSNLGSTDFDMRSSALQNIKYAADQSLSPKFDRFWLVSS